MLLEDLLGKDIDPKRKERIKKASSDFGFFCTYYLAEHFHLEPAEFHQELYRLLMNEQRVVVAAPREHAKSTVVNMGFVLYAICYKLKHFIVIVSDTDTQAKYFLWSIKTELETNPRIREDFGDLTATDKWSEGDFITSNNIRVLARGAGASMRGLRYGAHRPDLVIVDDLENDEAVMTPLQRKKTENWFKRVLLNCVGPDGQVFIIGTILHYDSLLAKLLKDDYWFRRKYKAVKDDGTPLWPERWPMERLKQKEKEIGSLAFAQEFYNDPIDEESALFKEEFVDYFEPAEIAGKNLDIYGFVDPSLGGSQTADYCAIVTVGRDLEGYLYALDAWIERVSPDKLMEKILEKHQEYNYTLFGIETVAFQKVLKMWLDEKSRREGVYLPTREVSQGGINKEARIARLSPLVENGTLRFHKQKCARLVDQLVRFPKADHDDGPDALEGCVSLIREQAGKVKVLSAGVRKFVSLLRGYDEQ